MLEIDGIILQPLASSKYSWKNYNIKKHNFLDFFQKIMREEIGNSFDVGYNTKDYKNYLFIPYMTKSKLYKCFGSYYMTEGLESGRADLPWSCSLDKSFSVEFKEIVEQKDILDKAEMLGEKFEQISQGQDKGKSFHYLLHKPSKKFIDFITNIGKEKIATEEKICTIENSSKIKKIFNFSLNTDILDKDEWNERENSKRNNGTKAELLVYESIKNDIDEKVLSNEINKLFDDNKISEISTQITNLVHYTKNYDSFAPFDLISTRDDKLLYIEVKSTTGNEIYFSIQEIIFAYEHINNYQVKVVKDETIYNLDIRDLILEIYENISQSNGWSCETIKLKVNF